MQHLLENNLSNPLAAINRLDKVDQRVTTRAMGKLKRLYGNDSMRSAGVTTRTIAPAVVPEQSWAERQVLPKEPNTNSFYAHEGCDCNNHIAVIGIGTPTENAAVGQMLADNLPAMTRKSICYFDLGSNLDQLETAMARHAHVIIAHCPDTTERGTPDLTTKGKSARTISHDEARNSDLYTAYEVKQPYVLRRGDGISSYNQNALIADELAYISLSRHLPRTWLFLINPEHKSIKGSLITAKSNASLGKLSKTDYQRTTFMPGKTQTISADMEAALPRLTLKLQTLINDLLATKG